MDGLLDNARHFLGTLLVVMVPPVTLIWLIIHPWVRWWKRLGPLLTWLIVVPVVVSIGVLLSRVRGALLGPDLGTNWILIGMSAPFWAARFHYWRHLSISTAVGVPELSKGEQKGKLLREGIYGAVRHPRYLSAGLALVGEALFINYVGIYILLLLLVPVGYITMVLEERELVDRFGEDYRQYQREVPRFIPRWRRPR